LIETDKMSWKVVVAAAAFCSGMQFTCHATGTFLDASGAFGRSENGRCTSRNLSSDITCICGHLVECADDTLPMAGSSRRRSDRRAANCEKGGCGAVLVPAPTRQTNAVPRRKAHALPTKWARRSTLRPVAVGHGAAGPPGCFMPRDRRVPAAWDKAHPTRNQVK
jgi:hypothetical protein